MTIERYNSLSISGRVGMIPPKTEIKQPEGESLPLFLSGSFETKTRTYFKPKIPKTGKSRYRGIYMRSNKGFTYLYDIDSTIYIIALHSQINVTEWIDKNFTKIQGRVNARKI